VADLSNAEFNPVNRACDLDPSIDQRFPALRRNLTGEMIRPLRHQTGTSLKDRYPLVRGEPLCPIPAQTARYFQPLINSLPRYQFNRADNLLIVRIHYCQARHVLGILN